MPMPDPWIVTLLPLHVPVYPNMPRTSFTSFGFSRNVSAAHFALYGSPGKSTVSAMSVFFAPI